LPRPKSTFAAKASESHQSEQAGAESETPHRWRGLTAAHHRQAHRCHTGVATEQIYRRAEEM
jgi:hypothetical protein